MEDQEKSNATRGSETRGKSSPSGTAQPPLWKHPHDRMFRMIMEDRELLGSFLQQSLPPELVKAIRWESLEPRPESLVDRQLRGHFVDLLSRVELADGQGLQIYILLEHKSYRDPGALLQLLRYAVQVLSTQENRPGAPGPEQPGAMQPGPGRSGGLIPVYPLLFYHGREKHHPQTLRELFPAELPPALEEVQPRFSPRIVNLNELDDDQIRGLAPLRAYLLMVKHLRDDFETILFILDKLLVELGPELVNHHTFAILKEYILQGMGGQGPQVLEKLQALPEADPLKEELMTAAESIYREGIAKGIEKGKEEAMTIAESLYREGIAKGIEKGKEEAMTIAESLYREGIEKGKKEAMTAAESLYREGIEKGKVEVLRQMADKLFRSGMSLEQVAGITGLPLQDLQELLPSAE